MIRFACVTSLCAVLSATAACSTSSESTAEEELRDSFARPTSHGAMVFGVDHPTVLSDRERFHAWTFTLSGNATVDLTTRIGAGSNMDTVMYLYYRTNGAAPWGSSIASNDDYGGLGSRIFGTLNAGEYRVVVKAKKVELVGPFALRGTCTGPGCPATTCGPMEPLVPSTPYAATCEQKINAVIGTPVSASSNAVLKLSDRCGLSEIDRKAVDAYHAFWDGKIGWQAFADPEGEGRDVDVHVRTEQRGANGHTITVQLGRDGTGLLFVYDAAGAMLVDFEINEDGPRYGWFCATPGEAPAPEPRERCVHDALLRGYGGVATFDPHCD